MPKFSKTSLDRLYTCDERLQRVFNEVIKHFDCTIVEGHRGEKEQHDAFINGNSKLDWPHGKHNTYPSKAVDAMPYPIDWKDEERIAYFAGFVLGTATSMGITLRWGHDWNRNNVLKDEKFIDGPHYEILEET